MLRNEEVYQTKQTTQNKTKRKSPRTGEDKLLLKYLAIANKLCHRKTQIARVKTSSVLKMVELQK